MVANTQEAAPGLQRAVLMIATINAASPIWYRMFKDVAPTLAIEPISAPTRNRNEIEGVIKSAPAEPHTALIVLEIRCCRILRFGD
jgi:hypothetical protein